ncbi:MAG: IS5 family transposase [Dechloromonas sp.]|uniref:IS5 family transposase n=1 Tax=Dechloromonas sp. TaxID=1917218 RepID=UPI0027ED7CA5|nr:IS5 family transposase [Dechloromonas sp.]MBT9519346.1 IS5 family transposase [Dechloromonas sp.]
MKQLSLAETGFLPKAGEQTRKAGFLAEMETVVPWSRLESLIEPHYPKKGNGQPPMPLGKMLRIHFMLQWFGYSDPAMEEALHDVPMLRQFAGLDAFEDVMPDESTILRFRHLLEKHDLAVAIFAEVNAVLSEKGLSMKRGTVVDATLIAAPSSTKNEDKKRDPEMRQTKKGNQWHFGMKAHIGIDADSGLIHPVECTTAKMTDITMMEKCLHGEEAIALGDRGYHKKNRTIDDFAKEDALSVLTSTEKPAGGQLSEEQKAFNRMLLAVRGIVEHPFREVKRQFGFVKVRYRGLAKNTGQIVTLFALANLWLARKRLLPLLGEVRP